MSELCESNIKKSDKIKHTPRFEKTFVRDERGCKYILWYHPTGTLSVYSTYSASVTLPDELTWDGMELDAVKDYYFPEWRNADEIETLYISHRVISMVSKMRRDWSKNI